MNAKTLATKVPIPIIKSSIVGVKLPDTGIAAGDGLTEALRVGDGFGVKLALGVAVAVVFGVAVNFGVADNESSS